MIDLKRNRLILVCEDHSKEGEAVNTISSVGQAPMSGPWLRCPSCNAHASQAASPLQQRVFLWGVTSMPHHTCQARLDPLFMHTDLLSRQLPGLACCKTPFKLAIIGGCCSYAWILHSLLHMNSTAVLQTLVVIRVQSWQEIIS